MKKPGFAEVQFILALQKHNAEYKSQLMQRN